MADSVRLRLRSDVPLGVFLSGGVDSSVIAYEATQVLGESVHAFTVATGSGLDESEVAGRTASSLGIRSTVLPLEFDALESLHTVVAHYDQPFADSSAIPSLALSRLAREHVTVVLNGDGGDEVFGGYRRHVAAHLAGRLAGVPDRLLGVAERGLSGRGSSERRGAAGFAQRIVRGLQLDPEDRYLAWSTDMLLDVDKRQVWRGGDVTDTKLRVRETRRGNLGALDQQLATDIDLNLLSDLLVKMDMATMAHSLEGRSPFLDHRVAEYVWSLPAHVRLPRGRAKGLLRDSYQGLLSDEVIRGKKKGFEVPVSTWLAEDWRSLVGDVLTVPSAHVKAYVDGAAVDETRGRHPVAREEHHLPGLCAARARAVAPEAGRVTRDLAVVSIYGPTAPSTRVRAYEWLDHLGLDATRHEYAELGDHSPRTALTHLSAIAIAEKRVRSLSRSSLGGTVFLSREASPWSTGGVESRLLRAAEHGVYDLDDALFEDRLGWRRILGKRQKVEQAAEAADVVIAGNALLADFLADHHRDVRMIPTCVQPGHYESKPSYDLAGPPTLVWLGSRSTEAYLTGIAPALREVHRRTGARVRIISAASDVDIPGLEGLMHRVTWTPTSYAAQLASADIALAPLHDDPFARGKCAYKLLQYAATGLPMVGSPVGADRACPRALLGLGRHDARRLGGCPRRGRRSPR